MRSFLLVLIFVLSFCTVALPQHANHDTKKDVKEQSAAFIPGMGSHHHLVSSTNAEAQKFFDQGLSLVFAFNHEEAIRSFMTVSPLLLVRFNRWDDIEKLAAPDKIMFCGFR